MESIYSVGCPLVSLAKWIYISDPGRSVERGLGSQFCQPILLQTKCTGFNNGITLHIKSNSFCLQQNRLTELTPKAPFDASSGIRLFSTALLDWRGPSQITVSLQIGNFRSANDKLVFIIIRSISPREIGRISSLSLS